MSSWSDSVDKHHRALDFKNKFFLFYPMCSYTALPFYVSIKRKEKSILSRRYKILYSMIE